MADPTHSPAGYDEDREAHTRLALPLLVPAMVFLFAVLVIYGLSRIYLELDTYHVGDVSMATPLAIGVALGILLTAAYFASQPRVSRGQVAFVVVLSVALLTGGSIWAAVHNEPTAAVEGPTPTPGGTVTAGGIGVTLGDFNVTPAQASAPAGSVTFNVSNIGGVIHNFRVIKTELDPAALPVSQDDFAVDETAVDVVGELTEMDIGITNDLTVDLEAGAYVLICNVPGHYQSGMHTAFTVE